MTNKEDTLIRFISWLSLLEHRGDCYIFTPRDFRMISSTHLPSLELDYETAMYLMKCCLRVNKFFEGTFILQFEDIKDLDGLSDDKKVGNHWILDKVGNVDLIKKLIMDGQFDPYNAELWT